MSYLTGEFGSRVRSTRDFMEPIPLDPADSRRCHSLSATLGRYGLALVRSDSFDPEVRKRFVAIILDYLTSRLGLEGGSPVIGYDERDLRRELGFQYGPTPIGEEVALCSQHAAHAACKAFVDRLDHEMYPFTVPGTDYPDRKGRFMSHLITRRHGSTGLTAGRIALASDPQMSVELDPRNVTPASLSGSERSAWEETMLHFGMMMLEPVTLVTSMLARGLGLEADCFTSCMDDGHHKVAPTFASLFDDRAPGTVQAALHQDIDFFAIHARGTHPGLYVYTETGERLEVTIPEGCYLVQAGRQLYLKMRSMERSGECTAAPIRPGWHEVVVTPDAIAGASGAIASIEAILRETSLDDEAKLARIRPLYRDCIRISCTFFYHLGDRSPLVYGLAPGEREEGVFPDGTKVQRYIGLELGFIKLST